nr:hypothetical protein [Candidatus Sigynarchaeota archaeon]
RLPGVLIAQRVQQIPRDLREKIFLVIHVQPTSSCLLVLLIHLDRDDLDVRCISGADIVAGL